MPEVQSSPTINPTIEMPKRNWKKTLLILFILLFLVSLIGIGLYLLIPRLVEEPVSQSSQKQATPSAKQKPHPLKNKIIFTKSIITDSLGIKLLKVDTDVYAMNPDSGGKIKIFDFEPTGTDFASSMSLSPKGTYLAWIRGNLFEYTKPDRTTQKKAKKIGPIKDIQGYSFSPDETKIAILVGEDSSAQASGFTSLIVEIHSLTDGKLINKFKTITGGPNAERRINANNKSIAWVSDKSIVTFIREEDKDYLASYLINKGNTSEKRITEPSDGFHKEFGLNQSKTKIVYVIQKWTGNFDESKEKIWVANVDGSNKKVVGGLSFGSIVQDLRFSPDGNWLVIASNNAESTEFQLIDLVENKIVGGKVAALGNLVWSPDSKKLVVADGVYANRLVTVGLDGKIIKELTLLSGQSNEVGSVSRYGLVGWIE